MLDLGVFMAIQSLVERKICGKVPDKKILADVVVEAFEGLDPEVLRKVHQRWIKVLYLIRKGNGTNDMVKKERGLKTSILNKALENNNVQQVLEDLDMDDVLEEMFDKCR